MFRRARGWIAVTALTGVLCLGAGAAHAHAPIPRRVALTPDGASVALSLPGFGLVLRSAADQPFAYACDALLGLKPSDRTPSFSFLRDGSLLLGSVDGVRRLSPDGCPEPTAGGELAAAAVVALAVQHGATETAYAVVSGAGAGVWQSQDGGAHWLRRAELAHSELTSALVTAGPDASRVYLSLHGPSGPTLLASTDGGATLTSFPQALPLILLSAEAPAPYPLWAMARDALTAGNRGIAILRAAGPAGPWQLMLRVDYFGGFAVDDQGVIWVGDELGGVYRSSDGGDSFHDVAPDAEVACLAAEGEALVTCGSSTPDQAVLQRLGPDRARVDVLALAEVDRLVSCPALDVATTCRTAWSEWQRDVRMLPSVAPGADGGATWPADAGVTDEAAADARVEDGESEPPEASQQPAEADAGEREPSASAPSTQAANPGCSVVREAPDGPRATSSPLALALSATLGAFFVRRARRRTAP